MPKVFVSLNAKRLAQLDRAAKRAGLNRSAYVARLVERDIETTVGPGAPAGEVTNPIGDLRDGRLVGR